MHSDHVEGFIDVMQLRWHNVGAKLDVVRSADAVSPLGHTVSCKKFAAHIGDTLFHAGEIAQRATEDKRRPSGGPAELTNVITFEPGEDPQSVWTLGESAGAGNSFYPHARPCLLSRGYACCQCGHRR
jgi:ribonuclease Z